jgi:hypothetical protein
MYDIMEAREVIYNLAVYLGHHSGTWVYAYFAAEDAELAQMCYFPEDSKTTRSNKEHMWDDPIAWDTEFQVQIENIEKIATLNGEPQGAAGQNLMESVGSMSFMDRHASAVSNKSGSITASVTHQVPISRLFPNAALPPHITNTFSSTGKIKYIQNY